MIPLTANASFDRRGSPSSTSSSVASAAHVSGTTSAALSPQSQSLGLSRSLSRSLGPPEMLQPAMQFPSQMYGPYQAQWSRNQPAPSELPTYALPSSWGTGQYMDTNAVAALPSGYQFDDPPRVQAQPGSRYPGKGHTYMPYDQSTSQL